MTLSYYEEPPLLHLKRMGEAACGASRRSIEDRYFADDPAQVDCKGCKRTLPYQQWLRANQPPRREASGRHDVYPLGHYEQMVIQRALEESTDATVRSLATIFASHGTVTIIRENEEE